MKSMAPMGYRRGRSCWLAAALVAVATFVLGAPTAGAQIIERGSFTEPFTFAYDDCGFPVQVTGEFTSRYRIRQGKGKTASAFFLHDRFSYREVHTNLLTGRSFVVRGNGLFNEIRARRVSGNVFEFTAIEAGQPFVMEDSAGNVVLRDRGVIRYRILFDTLGDNVPGGELIHEFEPSVHGPHPGFDPDEFCAAAARLTGA